jgi:hypothetical protein
MTEAQTNPLLPADFIVPSPDALAYCWDDGFISAGCSTSGLNVCVYAFWAVCFLNISLRRSIRLRRNPHGFGTSISRRSGISCTANENDGRALTLMPNKLRPPDRTGPMGMQPVGRGPSAPTQMLPAMPGAKGEMKAKGATKTSAAEKKQRTRADAMRAALARIARRNSLRKQRDALKS